MQVLSQPQIFQRLLTIFNQRLVWRWGALACLPMLCMCVQAAQLTANSPAADDSIVGGSPTNNFPAVGLVLNLSSDNNQITGECSGSLVGPSLVLTAAHCVLNLDSNGQITASLANANDMVFYADASINTTFNKNDDFGVKSIILPSGTDYTFGNNYPFQALVNSATRNTTFGEDLALLVLKKSSTITPLQLGAPGSAAVGAPVQLVGYGSVTYANGAGAGTRRFTETTVTQLIDTDLLGAGNATHGTCTGDSGGPLLYKGQIIAITRSGVVDGQTGACIGDDVFTRVDNSHHSSFVQQNLP